MKDKKLQDIQDQLDKGVDFESLLNDDLKQYLITTGLVASMEQIDKLKKQVKELQKQVKEIQERKNIETKGAYYEIR